MKTQLSIDIGQYSSSGVKEKNQDFHDIAIPESPLLGPKGIAIAIADGISSSDVSDVASQTAVNSFLSDYLSTPESWSVNRSVIQVLNAANSWLYAQTKHSPYSYDMNKGYVCAFGAIVFKSRTAYLFHVGDTRIYRLGKQHIELMTEDHRLWISENSSYLSRALGMKERLEVDYQQSSIDVGDIFLLVTDGVYEHISESRMLEIICLQHDDLDLAAKEIVEEALQDGSTDNLTILIARINTLPDYGLNELHDQANKLPFPPELKPRMEFDGYQIVREVHHSSRSHVYMAVDLHTRREVALKVPSVDLRDDRDYLDRFLLEEWVSRRVNSPHIIRPCEKKRERNFLYIATEFIHGQTLDQWMIDNPLPDLEAVRNIVEQVAQGLRALHRQEMLHQDLRPNNIMIDETGTAKIIDLGSVQVAGLSEITRPDSNQLLGTALFTAPEYFLGDNGSRQSDLYSLGVITYQMLSGKLPFGTNVAKTSTRSEQNRLAYRSLMKDRRDLPFWIDEALRKAVQINPEKRYPLLSEFMFDLRKPSSEFKDRDQPPLIERNPVGFWKGVGLAMFFLNLYLLYLIFGAS